jgi:hypothetical protein
VLLVKLKPDELVVPGTEPRACSLLREVSGWQGRWQDQGGNRRWGALPDPRKCIWFGEHDVLGMSTHPQGSRAPSWAEDGTVVVLE